MNSTPNFRALCAELLSALETEGYTHWTINPGEDPLCDRARAALAAPPPEPPTDEEYLQQVNRMCQIILGHNFGNKELDALALCVGHHDFILNPHITTPPPEPPPHHRLAARLKAIRNDYGVQHSADCQRAAELLERTATPPPEPPTDEELDDFIMFWWGSNAEEQTITDAIECGLMAAFARDILPKLK